MSRLVAALIAVSLVACGGDHSATAPPPPSSSPITRLVLQDTSALLFTGSVVPGAAFVAHAYDADGNEVANPELTLSAGAGWTVHGDTLIAPAGESRTTLRISAKRAAQSSATAGLVHFDVVGADSAASDSMEVTAAIDLRAHKWTVSYVCRISQPSSAHMAEDGTYLDSTAVTAAPLDSIVYASEVAAPDSGQDSPTWRWFRQMGALAQLWYSGTGILWRVDGKADTVGFNALLNLGAQAPDTLYWRIPGETNPSRTYPDWRWPTAPADTAPYRYVEAAGYASYGICHDPSAGMADTLWLTEVP